MHGGIGQWQPFAHMGNGTLQYNATPRGAVGCGNLQHTAILFVCMGNGILWCTARPQRGTG